MHVTRQLLVLFLCAVEPAAAAAQGQRGQPPPEPRRRQAQRPARDGERAVREAGTGTITGRALVADSGAPVRRARVVATDGRRPHAATTDDLGRYQLSGLAAGSYVVRVIKPGFVDGAFGQRRPLGAPTPLQLSDGQHLARVDIHMRRGGVITGRVLDEAGEPVVRARVAAHRYVYVGGERQLMIAATDETDDRGQFRAYGLPPGDYFVSATFTTPERRGPFPGALAARQWGQPSVGPAFPPAPVADEPSTGYAPTYYPGTTTASEAGPLKLAPSQELSGVDFQLQVVPMAAVRGTLAATEGTVFLVPEHGRGVRAQMARASVQPDGTFAITNVAPGKYTLVARSDAPDGSTRTAIQPIVITGEDVTTTLVPVPGVTLRGTVTFESAGTPTPGSLEGFRVSAQPVDPLPLIPRMGRPGRVTDGASFTVETVLPGRYVIQASGARGWTMKAAYLGGREITDEIVEIAGDDTRALSVIFTDRSTSLKGAVRDARGASTPGITVIAFPADATLWRPLMRRIQTARTNQNGEFRIAQLPPGDYLVAGVEDVEQGEWFDPEYLQRISAGASRVSIAEGEQKELDLESRAVQP